MAALRKAVSLYTWKKAVRFQIGVWEKWRAGEMILRFCSLFKGENNKDVVNLQIKVPRFIVSS